MTHAKFVTLKVTDFVNFIQIDNLSISLHSFRRNPLAILNQIERFAIKSNKHKV